MLTGHFLFNLHTVLKRAAIKKSKNDLIHAEEGEDHFTDICSVGEYWLRIARGLDLHLNVFMSCFLRAAPLPPRAAVSRRRIVTAPAAAALDLPKQMASRLPPVPRAAQPLHAAPLKRALPKSLENPCCAGRAVILLGTCSFMLMKPK